MEAITVKELQELREKADEQPLDQDDAFIDFATDDFINKNIRVRPISGTTNLGQQDRQSQISKNTANQDNEEAQESYQRLAEYEMENQRKLVKQKAALYQEELRRKQALEEKKNAKR
jgi:phosphatidate phosphatase PAH1